MSDEKSRWRGRWLPANAGASATVVPLYHKPTLTDAEREAVEWAEGQAKLFPEFEAIRGHAEALLGLQERLG